MEGSENGRRQAFLASTRLTTPLLAVLLAEIAWGTWVVAHEGMWEARRQVFANWLGGLPLVCALGAVHLGVALVQRLRGAPRRVGPTIAHAGVLLLLLAGALGPLVSRVSVIDLGPGERVSDGGAPGRWELSLVRRNGDAESVVTRSLGDVVEGVTIRFGEAESVVVAGYAANGVLGVDQSPIALPLADDPVGRVPAIAFDAFHAGEPPMRIALDGNRPVAGAAAGGVFVLRRHARPLPFALELREPFRDGAHEVAVRIAPAGGARRDAGIGSARPLVVGRFSVHLSGRRLDPRSGAGRVVLSVVENPLAAVPAWAAILVLVGLSLHGLGGFARKAGLLAGLLVPAFAHSAGAQPGRFPGVPPELAALPVRMDGRAMAFESLAEATALQLSGHRTIGGIDATRWLAALLFDPSRVRDLPTFAILDPELRDALRIPRDDRPLQPWSRLERAESVLVVLADAAGRRKAGERGPLDREALRLHGAWMRYRDLENAFAFLRPSSVAPFPGGHPPVARFLDLSIRSAEFAGMVDSLMERRFAGDSAADGRMLAWLRATFDRSDAWAGARFPVLPRRGVAGPWTSPAEAIARDGAPDPATELVLLDWDSLRSAWLRGDTVAAGRAAARLRDTVVARAGPSLRPPAMWAESVSHRLRPFRWGFGLFAAALLFGLLGPALRRDFPVAVGDLLSASGLVCVAGGLLLRMATTLRPPVSNAHEWLLAGCVVTVSVFLYAARRMGWPPGSPAAAACGFAHLLFARAFGTDGFGGASVESLLRSAFLADTRTAATGLGALCAALGAVSAHLLLARFRSRRSVDDAAIRSSLLAALALFAIGVLAEGLACWLDRGRFWGWEPSEVGRLVVVLWLALLLHARSTGLLGVRGCAVGAIASVPMVALAATPGGSALAGLRPGGAPTEFVWGFAAWCIVDGALVAWLLLADAARRAWRGFRLWRIRYVRSRNPRLRRHGDTGGWGEGSQSAM